MSIKKENISNQLLNLQLKHLSECISSIKRDNKAKNYVILFDKAEDLPPLLLDDCTYKVLMKHRDTLNSISVYDLFQEKISSV